MPNYNKVQLSDGTVLIDLTNDTITPNNILYGVSAHDASGSIIQGTLFQDKTQTEFLFYDISDSNEIAVTDDKFAALSVAYQFSNDKYLKTIVKEKSDMIVVLEDKIRVLEEQLDFRNKNTIVDSFGGIVIDSFGENINI